MYRINSVTEHALHNTDSTHRIEHALQTRLPPHTLMQRAGLAVAKLALAVSPHSQTIWIACGPGNNGGDGLEAAIHLQQWGKQPVVTWLGNSDTSPRDATTAYVRAHQAGVEFSDYPPSYFDMSIDALLGLGGGHRPLRDRMAKWAAAMNTSNAPVLAIDLPTGLCADTGVVVENHVRATHTLSLLTLKPGLFTASGRDASGDVWQDPLTSETESAPSTTELTSTARLMGAPSPLTRLHASHKGSYGDVAVIGGATGMTGAALLAASAALNAGAGRVFVGLLSEFNLSVSAAQPELMFRSVTDMDLGSMTVVCGCGGGEAIQAHMQRILTTAARVVIDADALNSIAFSAPFQALLTSRAKQRKSTVLTPHPLEAARLLSATTADVQNDRLSAAIALAQRFECTVVLKGSGTIVAENGHPPSINPTGNARLATAGTGDVLAGMISAGLSSGLPDFDAACRAVYHHGLVADRWPVNIPLTALDLAQGSLQ